MKTGLYLTVLAGLALGGVTSVNQAVAGGWDRTEQGLDLLFDPGKVAMEINATFSNVNRDYDSYTSLLGNGTHLPIGTSATRGYLALKGDITDSVSCLGTLRQAYALHSDLGTEWGGSYALTSKQASVDEAALTCSYKLKMGPGFARLIGGLTTEWGNFDFASRLHPSPYVGTISLDTDGIALGWRGGVSYEIPEYAFRASLVYYSATDLDAKGTFNHSLAGPLYDLSASVTTPQSVELYLQSGIAPGWRVFGSVKWMDWSVVQSIPVYNETLHTPFADIATEYRDGWTIMGGVGHQFTEQWAGSLTVAWDRGVSTGHDEYGSSWTAIAGARYAMNKQAELYGALAYTAIGPVDIRKPGQYNADLGWDSAVNGRIGVRFRMN